MPLHSSCHHNFLLLLLLLDFNLFNNMKEFAFTGPKSSLLSFYLYSDLHGAALCSIFPQFHSAWTTVWDLKFKDFLSSSKTNNNWNPEFTVYWSPIFFQATISNLSRSESSNFRVFKNFASFQYLNIFSVYIYDKLDTESYFFFVSQPNTALPILKL